MKKKSIKVRINGDLWKVCFGDAGKTNGIPNDGICIYDERKIVINKERERSLVNVLSHELLHARFPDIEEDAIEEAGTLIGEVYEEMMKLSFDKKKNNK